MNASNGLLVDITTALVLVGFVGGQTFGQQFENEGLYRKICNDYKVDYSCCSTCKEADVISLFSYSFADV